MYLIKSLEKPFIMLTYTNIKGKGCYLRRNLVKKNVSKEMLDQFTNPGFGM